MIIGYFVVLTLVVQAVVFGSFCSFIAHEKNRDSIVWFFLGCLFSFIALLALIAVPRLDFPVQEERPLQAATIKFATKLPESNCTHEGQTGSFCSRCGVKLKG